jgi:hypothetical protein
VQQALDAIHGVDLNPFAVAIARFRLMVAALRACGETSLEGAPAFRFHLAAGDSLLHGAAQMSMDDFGVDSGISGFAYATEDLQALQRILAPGKYDVVVGNPPYITVKDKKLNAAYRGLYPTCKGTYALTVPFMERFFQLAKPATGDRQAGWAAQITANSFMKREFGSRLIEEFLRSRTCGSSSTRPVPTSRDTGRRRSSSSGGLSRRATARSERCSESAGSRVSRTIQRRALSGRRSSRTSTAATSTTSTCPSPTCRGRRWLPTHGASPAGDLTASSPQSKFRRFVEWERSSLTSAAASSPAQMTCTSWDERH